MQQHKPRRRWTETDARFLTAVAPYCHARSLAVFYGLSLGTMQHRLSDMKIALGKRQDKRWKALSADQLRAVYAALQDGRRVSLSALRLVADDQHHDSRQNLAWTSGEIAALGEMAGERSRKVIAQQLRRTIVAVKQMMMATPAPDGNGNLCRYHRRYSAVNLAGKLGLTVSCVSRWYRDGLLPCFHDTWGSSGMVIIPSFAAEWLLDNYRYRETDWRRLHAEMKEVGMYVPAKWAA